MVWDRALAYLANGDFAQGWVDYTARFRTGELPKRDLPGKRWNGQPYSGQTLLIVAEQGFGDTIWVSRYLAHVKALGGTLIVESRPELARLLSMQNLADQIVERGKPLPAADFHVHQCSLPGLFTPDRASIPQSPYLKPHADADRFAEAKAAGGKRLRVGLVWSGSLTFKSNHERSIPLDRMIEAFSMPDVALYSLQVGAGAQQMKGKTPDQIYDLSPLLRDFADTAAGLDMLDLVIMTDSAVAHLGGALGRPVWVLLGYSPYWMWGCAGEKTDWYESLRLFRCAAWNDWSSVLDAAAAALTVHLNRGRDGNAEDS